MYFTILLTSPCVAEFYEIWLTRSSRRPNHVYVKFLVNRFRGYGVLKPQISHFQLTFISKFKLLYHSY